MGTASGEDKTGSKRRLSRKKENSETETGSVFYLIKVIISFKSGI